MIFSRSRLLLVLFAFGSLGSSSSPDEEILKDLEFFAQLDALEMEDPPASPSPLPSLSPRGPSK